MIGRRNFITLLGGSAVVRPLSARAQQAERMQRIGVLTTQAESDQEVRSWMTAFVTRLQELGWTEGQNIRIDFRWGGGDATRIAPLAKELIALQPDVLLAGNNSCAVALRQYTFAIPIVFTLVGDPVAAGLVTNLARPEGNVTGFANFEFSIGGKWLELLKECAPSLRRAAVFFDPSTPPWFLYVRAIEAAAPSLGVQLIPFSVQSDAEIERAFATFATEPNGAVILVPTTSVVLRREKIIALVGRHRLPAIYPYRFFVTEGGLMSYGNDVADQYRQAASYVHRLLKGEKPADLPVQQPTKFLFAINLKTAKALGLTIPASLLALADAVIE
jgi:putative tryptophan/tyrosine transport system substrate-binding protein